MNLFRERRPAVDAAAERFPDAQAYVSIYEKIEFDRRKRNEEDNKVQIGVLAEMKTADERDREESHSYSPKVIVSKGAATSYIQFEKLDIGAQFIETITALPGNGPYLCPGWYGSADTACRGESTIIIKTISGAEHRISVSRWKADVLYASLMKAWRENR